jgi:hypothetical protein
MSPSDLKKRIHPVCPALRTSYSFSLLEECSLKLQVCRKNL